MRGIRGFTYLGVLLIVAIVGVLLAIAGQAWHTQAIREREADLLWVGDQYRRAIARFYSGSPGTARYPRELAELLEDPRRPDIQRYLRKLYPDPLTGRAEWGLVKAADGGIAGVFSLSEDRPFKVSGFKLEYADFEGREKYSDWRFVFLPADAVAPPKPPTP
jgi:type II secretory pathway pseudopilin PulG